VPVLWLVVSVCC